MTLGILFLITYFGGILTLCLIIMKILCTERELVSKMKNSWWYAMFGIVFYLLILAVLFESRVIKI